MSKPLRVLIVEDVENDALLVIRELERGGYDVTPERVDTAEGMTAALDGKELDVVIADHSMPHFSGPDALNVLRESGLDLPFIIVSGSIGEDAAVECMKAGAHDYLMKGNLTRLAAAIERELRDAAVRRVRKRAQEDVRESLVQLRRTLLQTVNALASVVEHRDPYTAGHQRRVAELACAIAEEMALAKEQIDGLHLAGTIHDIGKTSVPAEILTKPTRLSEMEFTMIKAHSQAGHDILETIEFPWPIAQIVLQHHERMDGSGYPQGISGEEILLEARILGVADVVEAMSSHRPYRPALGIDKALEEISQQSSNLYDSEVVDACVRIFAEKRFEFK